MKIPIKLGSSIKATALLLATVFAAVLVTASANAVSKKTYFEGEEIGVSQVQGELFAHGADLYILNRELTAREEISDTRLKGYGYFKYAIAANMATGEAEFWGSSRIVPDQGGGEWSGYFVATMGPEGHGIQMTVQGSGAYAGLVARLNYKTVEDKLLISGYVEVMSAGDRPFKVEACRTERIETIMCLVLDPETWMPYDPPVFAPIVKVGILQEAGTATHFGRKTTEGLWLFNPSTADLTGAGAGTAANGNRAMWVCSGNLNPEDSFVRVDFCGGTGRFDAVTGGFDVTAEDKSPEPTEDPNVFLKTYCYTGIGVIRY